MRRIIVSFLILLAPIIAYADVSTFVFTSAPALTVNERQTITVQSQNSSGLKENVQSTTCLEIRTTSASGKLFASANSVDPVSILILTMSKNSANRNFYYEESQDGSYTFNLKATYRPAEENRTCPNWPVSEWGNVWSASQNYTAGSAGTGGGSTLSDTTVENSTSQAVVDSSESDAGGVYEPLVPEVTVEIKAPKTSIVGAQIFVSGEGYGLEKKPLENPKYFWNFGDGTIKEGKSVAHTYRNVGEYALMLDVSSGKYSGSARQVMSVVKSPIFISKISLGNDGLIEIKNEASAEFDLSGWIVDVSGSKFVIPRNTFILPRGTLILSGSTLGFAVVNPVSLLYANGSTASTFSSPKEVVVISQSVKEIPVKTEVSIAESPQRQPKDVSPDTLVANSATLIQESSPEGKIMSTDQGESASEITTANYWWFIAFIALIAIASGSVFLIQKPKQSLVDEFTIEE